MVMARDAILTLPACDGDQYMANRQGKSDTLLRSSRPQDGGLISYKIMWKDFGNKVRITILVGFMCYFFCLERSPLEGMLHVLCFLFAFGKVLI